MEEVQALIEQLQQLKASNEQLREQLREQAQPPNLVPGPSAGTANVTSVNSPVDEAINTRYIYVPKERKCPKFTGKMSVDLLTVEQWVEEVRRCLGVRQMPLAEQLLFVTDHLDAAAKSEVNFHPSIS